MSVYIVQCKLIHGMLLLSTQFRLSVMMVFIYLFIHLPEVSW